jgi:hypothetical protein
MVELKELVLPEFSKSSHVGSQAAYVFKGQCDYNVIFGRDFLRKIGMSQDYDQGTMMAFDITTSMKPKSFYTNSFSALANILDADEDEEIYNCFMAILESKYEKADIQDIVNHQVHLNRKQRKDLHTLLKKSSNLFSGDLDSYPIKKMHLDLLPNAKPIHAKPYPIPQIHFRVFKNELECLVQLGILSRVGGTERASPTFIIPKKDKYV